MFMTIIADASMCPNTMIAGYAFWIGGARGNCLQSGVFKDFVETIQVAEMMASNSSEDIKIEFSNEIRKNEVLDTVVDITLVKNKLGWEPIISLFNGLKGLYSELSQNEKHK